MRRFLLWGCLFVFLSSLHTIVASGTTADDENKVSEEGRKNDTSIRAIRYPCQCGNLQCGCCTGNVLQNFNINIRQKGCVNMTYDQENFAVGMLLSFNDRVLYKTKVSGKNPPPACIPIPGVPYTRFCVRLSNVYFIGRNIHACVTLEAQWNQNTMFSWNFDCIRVGADGMSIVKPEDGGGLPHATSPPEEVEDYDEAAGTDSPPSGVSVISRPKPTPPTNITTPKPS